MINNSIYEEYGDRWYTAYDDPIALLRCENEAKLPWVLKEIRAHLPETQSILDVGCGAGFMANRLAREGFKVTGLDLSQESLNVARRHDSTQKVEFTYGNAYELPYEDETFDVVVTMDFLEHVYDPQRVIRECARVLKPGGLFFYHTFNRNPIAEILVIKFVEKFVKNTPKDMHILELFIRPDELMQFCKKSGLENMSITGLRPVLSSFSLRDIMRGIVPATLRFTYTKDLTISYLGMAKKHRT